MRKWRRIIFVTIFAALACVGTKAQINTERMLNMGRSALMTQDYVLAMSYFNQVIQAKPFLPEPYFLRSVAKFYLEDWRGAESDCNVVIEMNPFVKDAYELRGLSFMHRGNFAMAKNDFREALVLDPHAESYMHNLIVCHLNLDECDSALICIDRLLAIKPKYTPAMSMRSQIMLQRNDTASALADINRALEIDRYNADLYYTKAIIVGQSGHFEESEQLFDTAIYLNSWTSVYYLNRALVRYNLNNLNGAMADYDMAVNIDPSNITAYYNRGILRAQVGDDNRAIEDFDMVIDYEPDNYMAIFNRALLRRTTGNLKGAIQDFTAVLEEYPTFLYGLQLRAETRQMTGDIKGSEQDQFTLLKLRTEGLDKNDTISTSGRTRKQGDKNVRNYRKLIVSDTPDNNQNFASEYRGRVQNKNVDVTLIDSYCLTFYTSDSPVDRVVRYSNDISALETESFLPQLKVCCYDVPLSKVDIENLYSYISKLSASIRKKPTVMLLVSRAICHYLLHDYENAMNDCIDAIVLDGDDMWAAYFCRSVVRQRTARDRMDYNMILSDLDKTIDLAPNFQYAYYNRANMYAESGNYKEAIEDYTKAISIDKNMPESYFNRGIIYVLSKEENKGITDLSRAGEFGIYQSYNIIKRITQ